MSIHAKAYYQSAYNAEREASTYLAKCVKDAVWPWNPGNATLWRNMEEEFIDNTIKFYVKIELFPKAKYPDHIFVYKIDPLDDLELQIRNMGQDAFKFYRYRPALPVDDHIILGEE